MQVGALYHSSVLAATMIFGTAHRSYSLPLMTWIVHQNSALIYLFSMLENCRQGSGRPSCKFVFELCNACCLLSYCHLQC